MTLHIFWQLAAGLLSVPWPGYYVVNFNSLQSLTRKASRHIRVTTTAC
jgi:hypothetical protein